MCVSWGFSGLARAGRRRHPRVSTDGGVRRARRVRDASRASERARTGVDARVRRVAARGGDMATVAPRGGVASRDGGAPADYFGTRRRARVRATAARDAGRGRASGTRVTVDARRGARGAVTRVRAIVGDDRARGEAASRGDGEGDGDDPNARNWDDAIELGGESTPSVTASASGAEANKVKEEGSARWAKLDVSAALSSFSAPKWSGVKKRRDEEKGSSIKVSNKKKVIDEWGDAMSWDASRKDGTALNGEKARTPDLFDAILGQSALDVDELETLDRQRRAKRIRKELEKRRRKRERAREQEKRKARELARLEARKKGDAFLSGEWDEEYDAMGEEEERADAGQTFVEAMKEFAQSDAARWMFNFFVVPSLISKAVTFTIIDPIVAQELKLAGEDRTTIELRDDQETEILEKLGRYQQRMEFEILMGRQAPVTAVEKEKRIRDEARRLEDEAVNHVIQVDGNRYGDLVFITAFLIMVVVYADQARLVVTGSKTAFFSLEPAQQAFLLLLSSDVLVGYHSADAWQTLLRSIGGHYGIPEQEELISLFVAFVPVSVDVLFKFWVFKYLRRMAPSTQVILDDIDRH